MNIHAQSLLRTTEVLRVARADAKGGTPMSLPVEDAVELLRNEFLELPGLCLAPVHLRRLLDLDAATVQAALDRLVQLKFLRRTNDGRYRPTDAAAVWGRRH